MTIYYYGFIKKITAAVNHTQVTSEMEPYLTTYYSKNPNVG
jgi:hypothetical protein